MKIWLERTQHGTSQGKYVICCDKTRFSYKKSSIIGRLYKGTLTDDELETIKEQLTIEEQSK